MNTIEKRKPPSSLHNFPCIECDRGYTYFVLKLDWVGDLFCVSTELNYLTTLAIGSKWQESGEYTSPETAKILRDIISKNN